MSAGLLFLGWARQGLGAGVTGTDPLTAPLPVRSVVELGVRLNQRATQKVKARLYGPGDVTGIDPRQVIRTDPPAGASDFEPNNLVSLELDAPDLPWLLTPASAAANERLRPWLALIVVEAAYAKLDPPGSRPLPALTCRRSELPDLSASHLWAHAQVAVDGTPTEAQLADLLLNRPERNLSRLISPRRLAADTRYLAALVPAFEPGRRAGLNIAFEELDGTQLRPAWTPGDGDVQLPVYHSWTFATGPEGDFESLVRRLAPRAMPATLGLRAMDISRAAPGMPELARATGFGVLALEGALRSPATVSTPWDPRAERAFAAALEERLHRPLGRVAPPIYGSAQARADRVPAAEAPPRWLRDLNLDPRQRAAAGFGARVVQHHQEALMAAAWEQAERLRAANAALRQGQLARTAALALHDRVKVSSAGGPPVARQKLLQVTYAAKADLGATTALAANPEALATTTPEFRRLTRARGPLARRLMGAGTQPLAPPVEALALRSLRVNPPLKPAPGVAVLGKLSGESLEALSPGRITPRSWEGPPRGPTEAPVPAEPQLTAIGAGMPNRVFATASGRMYSCVTQDTRFGWVDHGPPPGSYAVGRATALSDLAAYVRAGDGTLRVLRWDGDRWAWENLNDPGVAMAGQPVAHIRNEPPKGSIGTSRMWQGVFVIGADGNLWEHRNNWINWGNPGTALAGTPGIAAAHSFMLTSASGRLFDFTWDANAQTWNWRDRGQPSNDAVGSTLSAPVLSGAYRVVMRRDGPGALFLFQVIATVWSPLGAPEAVGAILGSTAAGIWVSSFATGKLYRGVPGGEWQSFGSPPGIDTLGVTLNGSLRGEQPIVAARGRFFELRADGQWRDFGPPAPGGRGDPGALPPAHRRWRPRPGYMASMVAAHVEGGVAQRRIGKNVDLDANVTEGYTRGPAMPDAIANANQGLGIALADLNGSGRPDLVVAWVAETGGGNFPSYRIGWDLDAAGNPASWSPVKRLPTPVVTNIGSSGALSVNWLARGIDVAVGDLDGDGRLELVIAYATGEPTPRAFYRVGFGLDPAGDVTGGWTESLRLPAPSGPVIDVGLTLMDADGDFRPELVAVLLEQVGGGPRATYHVGWKLNARGFVTGSWTSRPVGGPAMPADARGIGVDAVDFSGSEHPDLVVLHLNTSSAFFRVGWDFENDAQAKSWSDVKPVDTAGSFPGTIGAGIAFGDIDPALVQRRAAIAAAFRTAATAHQAHLTRAGDLAAADTALPRSVPSLAAQTSAEVNPEVTVPAKVVGGIPGVTLTQLATLVDPLDPLVAAPVFSAPMYKPLADLSQDLLLPGVDAVPSETVTLLEVNAAFIEAYMAGLNHELSRELLWREFPADRGATFFRHFWDSRSGVPTAGPLTDIPPLHEWDPSHRLGENTTGAGEGDMLLLLIRGELLRRYPGAAIYARRAAWGPTREPRVLAAEIRQAQFRGQLEPDLTFFGFPLTVQQARGTVDDAGWFFVLHQPPTAPRFGVDELPANATYGGSPVQWRDLHEGHLAASKAALDALANVPAAPPFGALQLPVKDGSATRFTWAFNAAHMAQILFQPPMQLAVHATDMLPDA